FTISRDDSKN
nr:immunoglobulin heavy chain junction region [Homo sapiens]